MHDASFAPSDAARRAGVTLETLRYYEREGLVGPIERTAGGIRAYTPDDLAWIGIVTCLRDAGLGIADLRRFTTLLRSSGADVDRVTFLRARMDELLERRRQTDAALVVLADKIAYYSAEQK
jgi:DNA-binding transcriptional MerR regulator